MYHALLTNRYLTSRVIPLIAVGAVALCVALVIIVVSVMTGFLDMVKSSGKKLIGDVVVSYQVSGVPHYEQLIERIDALEEAEAATPIVESFGLLRMPYPDQAQKQTATVQLWGIEPESFNRVTGFESTLEWKTVSMKDSPDKWVRLFSDVLDRHWKETFEGLSMDQRVALLREALMTGARGSEDMPNDELLRMQAAEMSDHGWHSAFLALSDEPQRMQKVLTAEQWQALLAQDERLLRDDQIVRDAVAMSRGGRPGIVLGIHVSEGNERQQDGTYLPMAGGYWWMPAFPITLTTLPMSGGDLGSEPESVTFNVVNEFKSGVYLIDQRRVMIPLETAQRMLGLDRAEIVDEDNPDKVLGVDPPRATSILVRAKENVTAEQLRDAVSEAYDKFYNDLSMEAAAPPPRAGVFGGGASVRTWTEQQAAFIGPVEKERELMRTLFSIVNVVCAALVLSIFWAIVYEKTRDIGILRSIGASRSGIVWIFLRYGLVVGLIGSAVGVGLGYLIISNINSIHDALAKPPLGLALLVLTAGVAALVLTVVLSLRGALLPLVVGSLFTCGLLGLAAGILFLRRSGGVVIWDPSVYYFTRIPNTMDVTTAISTVIGAVVFSLLGAIVPAAKAADTDPVRALRYE